LSQVDVFEEDERSGGPSPQMFSGGKEVAFWDNTSEWAVWYQDINFEIHKCAFDDEADARGAFATWSFVRILTQHHVELDAHGILFAPLIGAIRRTIDESRPLPPSPGGPDGSSDAATPVPFATDGGASEDRPFSVFSSGACVDQPGARGASEWAVWTWSWFETRRYHFDDEASARAALEAWHSVRMLSRHEREVAARVRWESMAMSSIREAMEAHRVRLHLP